MPKAVKGIAGRAHLGAFPILCSAEAQLRAATWGVISRAKSTRLL